MFGFFRKKKRVTSNTSGTTIPSDSIADRGAWLGIAYLKASGGDLQLLMKLCGLPMLPKQVQNRIRLEMAIFSLSKSTKIIEPLLRERFAGLPPEAISQIKKTFLDGVWRSIGGLFPQELNDMAEAYADYIDGDDKSALFWSRLIEHGMSIEVENKRRDLNIFEQTVLHGTALTLALDSLSVSQDQIEHDHDSFFKQINK